MADPGATREGGREPFGTAVGPRHAGLTATCSPLNSTGPHRTGQLSRVRQSEKLRTQSTLAVQTRVAHGSAVLLMTAGSGGGARHGAGPARPRHRGTTLSAPPRRVARTSPRPVPSRHGVGVQWRHPCWDLLGPMKRKQTGRGPPVLPGVSASGVLTGEARGEQCPCRGPGVTAMMSLSPSCCGGSGSTSEDDTRVALSPWVPGLLVPVTEPLPQCQRPAEAGPPRAARSPWGQTSPFSHPSEGTTNLSLVQRGPCPPRDQYKVMGRGAPVLTGWEVICGVVTPGIGTDVIIVRITSVRTAGDGEGEGEGEARIY